MNKKDLMNGMIVEIRDGFKYLYLDEILRGDEKYIYLSSYNDDLTIKNRDASELDVVKIYKNEMYPLKYVFDDRFLEPIWVRQKPTELSPEEIQLLKALDVIGFKYIEKNIAEEPFAYIAKPVKDKSSWLFNGNDLANDMVFFRLKKELFTFITWADEKPTSIKKLLEQVKE